MKPLLSLDPAYMRWRAEFEPFEARCLAALCEFVRVHCDESLNRYYWEVWEGHESTDDFPTWGFERYLREIGRAETRDPVMLCSFKSLLGS